MPRQSASRCLIHLAEKRSAHVCPNCEGEGLKMDKPNVLIWLSILEASAEPCTTVDLGFSNPFHLQCNSACLDHARNIVENEGDENHRSRNLFGEKRQEGASGKGGRLDTKRVRPRAQKCGCKASVNYRKNANDETCSLYGIQQICIRSRTQKSPREKEGRVCNRVLREGQSGFSMYP